ncbi:TPA: hypothetical protein N0F65_010141 [Lagenidium giganteum]|uniref:Uncharacterized protein n=1 Tax=Lagenidium giganteum TaxID=4803 RepID=A0AAV2Z5U0_9STRA|nr:TPA: hypothetical protein N0F65_010141 [Lagenidium giganteum]
MVSSTLDVNAPPFYPSVSWYPRITDEYYLERPHSPGKKGFVIADAFEAHLNIPDEELFDSKFHPMTPEELLELDQVDEINEILAELELLETQEELHRRLTEKARDLRSNSDVEAEIRSLLAKSKKVVHDLKKAPKEKAPYHAKKNAFAHVHQPRAQY